MTGDRTLERPAADRDHDQDHDLDMDTTIQGTRSRVERWKRGGETVGFVPTMGALHAGHASLIARSVAENDHTVVSIFVNPTQFGPQEDLAQYPRTFDDDLMTCRRAGADLVFAPTTDEMYRGQDTTRVRVGAVATPLCGKRRPGHFDGVATVVTKLFNIVPATRAYFGQKDAQQLLVIKQMVEDLDIPVEVVPCPIVRESDGLAMSSRNAYLTSEERGAALCLSRALNVIEEAHQSGEHRVRVLRRLGLRVIRSEPLARLDYLEILNARDLSRVETVDREVLVALAVHFGACRLIDNRRLEAFHP